VISDRRCVGRRGREGVVSLEGGNQEDVAPRTIGYRQGQHNEDGVVGFREGRKEDVWQVGGYM
jgi:hypothetical protein